MDFRVGSSCLGWPDHDLESQVYPEACHIDGQESTSQNNSHFHSVPVCSYKVTPSHLDLKYLLSIASKFDIFNNFLIDSLGILCHIP